MPGLVWGLAVTFQERSGSTEISKVRGIHTQPPPRAAWCCRRRPPPATVGPARLCGVLRWAAGGRQEECPCKVNNMQGVQAGKARNGGGVPACQEGHGFSEEGR